MNREKFEFWIMIAAAIAFELWIIDQMGKIKAEERMKIESNFYYLPSQKELDSVEFYQVENKSF